MQLASSNTNKKHTVLVVDDDARNRALVRGILQSDYTILEADDAAEAIDLVAHAGIDLVLLDVMMPGTSGFEVCAQIKARETSGYLPVLMLTALDRRADRHTGLESGADDYLIKPIDRRELILRVRTFIKLRVQDSLIREQVEALRHLDALKDDLVSLIVHDMRNPLSGVMGFLSLVRMQLKEQPKLCADIDEALTTAYRLKDSIDDLLQVRMLEEGRVELRTAPHSLVQIVDEARKTLEGNARERGVEVRVLTCDDAPVFVDAKLLRRAVENLLVNAIKYSTRDSAVELAVRRGPTGGTVLEVCDRGPGIPSPVKNSLFQKFGGVQKEQDARRGFGLGLYLVHLVATAHGGDVSAHDREGGGTVFRLRLPHRSA
ncbi:MAG: HAMP domain-containing histidine kinase [Sandaracinaceae bacterium]|nr:HAMP domain-containing histidine kinase [Sandaracinaceae bacterium]